MNQKDRYRYSIYSDHNSIVVTPMNKEGSIHIHGHKELSFFIKLLTDQSPGWKLFSILRTLVIVVASVGAYKLLSQLYIRAH